MIEVDVVVDRDRAVRAGALLQVERVVAARAAVDRSRRRHVDRVRADRDVEPAAGAARSVDRRTRHGIERVGAVRAHRHAAVDRARVGKRIALAGRAVRAERHAAVDRPAVRHVDRGAAVRSHHGRVRADEDRADQRVRADRAGVVDRRRTARAVLDRQRHARHAADRHAGRAVHRAVVDDRGVRARGRIADHCPARQHAEARAECGRVDRAVVGQPDAVAGQRHRGAADAEQNAHARAGIDGGLDVVRAVRIARRKRVGDPGAGHRRARRAAGRLGGHDTGAGQRQENARRQQQSRKRFAGFFRTRKIHAFPRYWNWYYREIERPAAENRGQKHPRRLSRCDVG
ncbi:hypothetical protein L810_6710 [Burkholderia sp. AU4i]|nr:hypothetical protein L810_6710 [Burkholderia sp. AU4i]